MQKFIKSILNFILLTGAIVSVLTIDGGKWIISNPAFYQESMDDYQLIAPMLTGSDNENSIPVTGSQAAPGCVVTPAPGDAEWDQAYLILEDYQEAVRETGSSVGQAIACK